MINYQEYEITGDIPFFQSLEEVKLYCEVATPEELISYHEACIAENQYDYARYINRVIKDVQIK